MKIKVRNREFIDKLAAMVIALSNDLGYKHNDDILERLNDAIVFEDKNIKEIIFIVE